MCALRGCDRARIIPAFGPARSTAASLHPRARAIRDSRKASSGASREKKKKKCFSLVHCCREVRYRIRLRRQDAGDRVRRGEADPSDSRELRQVLHHDMQRARQHRVERQLHVAQIVPRAEQRVSTCTSQRLYMLPMIDFIQLTLNTSL